MALILNIDSAFEHCTVTLSNNEEVIAHESSVVQKDHASFLQPAILEICRQASVDISKINAVAVANGPGSYTGLRVGLSSAKGICYAMQKPLILINTLDVLAFALQQEFDVTSNVLISPMIDARRMEVFTALYNNHLELINDYASIILDEAFLAAERNDHLIITGGSGSIKFKQLSLTGNIIYGTLQYSMHQFALLSHKAFSANNFANLAYSEPFYLKPAYIK